MKILTILSKITQCASLCTVLLLALAGTGWTNDSTTYYIGYNSIGVDSTTFALTSRIYSATGPGKFTAGANDSIIRGWWYGHAVNTGDSLHLTVYTCNTDTPVTRIVTPAIIGPSTTTLGWYPTERFSVALTEGTVYAVAAGQGVSTAQFLWYFTAGATNSRRRDEGNNTLPVTFVPNTPNFSTSRYSFYVQVLRVEAAGSPALNLAAVKLGVTKLAPVQ